MVFKKEVTEQKIWTFSQIIYVDNYSKKVKDTQTH